MKSTGKMSVLMLLFSSVSAIQQQYRPPAGSNPWHHAASRPTWEVPDWNVNYKVPSYGKDRDMDLTLKNLATAEKELGHKLKASFKKPASHPINYFVPNFGQDSDIKETLDSLKVAEKEHKHKLKSSFKKKWQPSSYPVPNFGVDHDIVETQKSIAAAEKKLKSHFHATFKKPAGHPVNYKVPNFGVDSDIKDTHASLKVAEQEHKHKLYGKSFVQLESESDPICGSGGCNQYTHPKKPRGYPIDYPVPNFGTDEDINTTKESIDIAQKMYNHKWVMGTDYSRLQWHDWAADTKYDFNPELDDDIKITHKNLKNAENTLGHEWKF